MNLGNKKRDRILGFFLIFDSILGNNRWVHAWNRVVAVKKG
jgi:hypothetical protein